MRAQIKLISLRCAIGGLLAASVTALLAGVSSAAGTALTCATVGPPLIQSDLGLQVQASIFNTLRPGLERDGLTYRQCRYLVTSSRKLGPLQNGARSITYTSSVAITYITPATDHAWQTLVANIEDPYSAACSLAGLNCTKHGLTLKPLAGIATSAYWTETGRHSTDVATEIYAYVPGTAIIELTIPGKALQHAAALAKATAGLISS